MENHWYFHRCITDIVDGLRDGLSHFSHPSRAALIYALSPDAPVCIYDPHKLLHGHEPRIKEIFLDSTQWRDDFPDPKEMRLVEPSLADEHQYQLTGLISYGGHSRSIFYQTWYTEHHPDICCVGPTKRWLEYAARLLSRNITAGETLNIGTSGYVLQEYATHAVRDYIVDQRNIKLGWDTRIRIFPILDAVLGISKTLEEGALPQGQLVFVEPVLLEQIDFNARFPYLEGPGLSNFKHVRKLLLAVEGSERKLITNGEKIVGISSGPLPIASLIVDFKGAQGFLKLDDDLICSFADGRFNSSTRKANLVQVEELLLEYDLDSAAQHELFKIITKIVHQAGESEHGCTLVVDLNKQPIEISGQALEQPLDLRQPHLLDLAKSLAKVDGALHIGIDMQLYAFACLLDGRIVPGENRARGARYNSALRFTADHPELIVVVVSADRPVSVIQGGLELGEQCEWISPSTIIARHPTLAEWVES